MQEKNNTTLTFTEDQKRWMSEALDEARLALAHEDVPIGAVVVKDGIIIGRGHNKREIEHDPSAHAEIKALAEAGKTLGNWRLDGAELYVTMEPCPMCAFAMVLAKLSLVVYSLDDPRMGACGSLLNLAQFPGFNHGVSIRSGLMADESLALMQDSFTRQRRS
ncbi:MAG: tRNA adenosine(34) deaminase TadA [Peptococcaceae bacterium]|jgi:tRNA(adenine34) deaminase|nr:tRNA adenosine(34) deaminase TadA [Peptococcaceae bacterium]